MREYIITVKDPAVWDTGLWNELTVGGLGDNFIPGRSVEVLNERPFNDFSAHFNLTDEEAEQIRQDDRIAAVELSAHLQEGLIIGRCGTRENYNFDMRSVTTNTMKNWGLLRSTTPTYPFGASQSVTDDYTYNLDGTGVDVIVIDTGINANHPEFAVNADGTGGSRVVDFNWASLGVTGVATASQVNGYLGDVGGHGTHCAGVIAGNTQGFAAGASIYCIRIDLGEGNVDKHTGQTKGFIDSNLAFDLVKAFHNKKKADGNTRPTICSNSWGYSRTYLYMTSTVWRGQTFVTTSINPNYGQVNPVHPVVVDYVDSSVNSCASSGVILVGAAGNARHKIDVPGGQDYNNYYNSYFGQQFYHRGMSPASASSMINVGAIDNSTVERKVYFSQSGPRVDIYAPGTMVMSSYINEPYSTAAVPDPRNGSYYLNKLSGTSMAGPQVAGLLACVLQARPDMTTTEAKQFLIDHSLKNVLVEGGDTSYSSTTYLQGGHNRVLQTPFTSPNRGGITS